MKKNPTIPSGLEGRTRLGGRPGRKGKGGYNDFDLARDRVRCRGPRPQKVERVEGGKALWTIRQYRDTESGLIPNILATILLMAWRDVRVVVRASRTVSSASVSQ
jgi:hypothetical protein